MGGTKGNKNGVKLKSPEIRKLAYKQYCDWISKGKPKQAWCFEHPDYSCTWRTMEKYMSDNEVEFHSIHMEIAHCKGYYCWFDKGVRMVDGKVDKCQPAVYQMIMRNMWNWDRENSVAKDSCEPLLQKLAKIWRS